MEECEGSSSQKGGPIDGVVKGVREERGGGRGVASHANGLLDQSSKQLGRVRDGRTRRFLFDSSRACCHQQCREGAHTYARSKKIRVRNQLLPKLPNIDGATKFKLKKKTYVIFFLLSFRTADTVRGRRAAAVAGTMHAINTRA